MADIILQVEEANEQIILDVDVVVESGGDILPYYTGDYIVTPRIEEQILETKNKSMKNDVVVEKIPYSEVANIGGGKTATIGI